MNWRKWFPHVVLIAGLLLGVHATVWADPYAEKGDTVYRDIAGPLLYHTGMLHHYDGATYYVIDSDNDTGVSTGTFTRFLAGLTYRGSRTHPSGMNGSRRTVLLSIAEMQVGCAYSAIDCVHPGVCFRCDGLVEYCYEQVDRDILANANCLWLFPEWQRSEMVSSVINLPTASMSQPTQTSPCGLINVTATAADSYSGVVGVCFEYSTNNSSWYPLPGPDSAYGCDWYGANGWSLRFNSETAGITYDTSVWVRVRATDGAGHVGSWSQSGSFTVDNRAPSAPGQPTVSPNPACSGTNVTVSWGSVSGATYYRVYRDGSYVCSTSGTSCSVSAVAGSYTVKAENTCGQSGSSSGRTLTVITVPTAPGQPTVSPNPACSGTNVTVSWGSVSGATDYAVYRDGSGICTTTGTSCQVPAVAGNYTVKAHNDCGWSGASTGRTLTVMDVIDILWPPTLTPNPACSDTNVTVSWGAEPGTIAYRVYRDATQVWSGSTTSCQLPAIAGEYWVTAENECGLGGPSPHCSLVVESEPVVDYLDPEGGCAPGDDMSINGSGFWNDSAPSTVDPAQFRVVFVGEGPEPKPRVRVLPAECSDWTDSWIHLTVPTDAQSGPLIVRTSCGVSDSAIIYWQNTPVELALLSAVAGESGVVLEWYGGGGYGARYDVYRAIGALDGEYVLLESIHSVGDGMYNYVDEAA
ncbi:MAG: hypothetical protein ABIK85_06185, partial [Candidatus Eisenbacteria bacterium]